VLPFSTIEFFVIISFFIGWLFISKYLFFRIIKYSGALFILVTTFIIFYYPKPIHILLFIFYSYSAYWLLSKVLINKYKIFSSLILITPMILFKIFEHSYTYNKISELVFFPGISFVSFRVLSLFLDSKENTNPISLFSFINYIFFIPTLLIGPIDRYSRFNKDLDSGYDQLNLEYFRQGIKYLRWGILYKFILAGLIDQFWFEKIDLNNLAAYEVILDAYIYYLFLIFDFSGYSLMAMGLGKMMGVNVPINFIKPLLARNPKEFWKRFHKTLGDWLKDYFFIPLYKYFRSYKKFRSYPLLCQNMSLFLTFFLMGCWNGLSTNYVISGSIFGIYSIGYNTYDYYFRKNGHDIIFGGVSERITNYLSIIIMFNLVSFSLYIFSGRAFFI